MWFLLISAEHVVEESETCGKILTVLSWIVVCLTMPFSLMVCFKVVQEYERAVIFRLGRLISGGAKGPGIFFILPCIDAYARVDLRTRTYDIPPQEVRRNIYFIIFLEGIDEFSTVKHNVSDIVYSKRDRATSQFTNVF
ncbi:hypothetical protein WA026_018406 [Henosepilachna vigintioctopunctata]|uniref:Band 7 domain-containing protein n=1 Tax=Henosepilachna vigintioctopunctata TaxID=420089 RepID=A0AAW1V4F4_9CUCU